MTDEIPELGLKREKKHLYERMYKGKWVTVYSIGNIPPSIGLFNRIEDEHVILQPCQGGRWKEDGRLELTLIDAPEPPETIPLGTVGDIKPTTKESILNYCAEQTRESYISWQKSHSKETEPTKE
jgi:hypothetical protein